MGTHIQFLKVLKLQCRDSMWLGRGPWAMVPVMSLALELQTRTLTGRGKIGRITRQTVATGMQLMKTVFRCIQMCACSCQHIFFIKHVASTCVWCNLMLHYCTLPLSFTRFTVTYHTVYSIHEVTGTEETCAYHAPHWWFTGLWNCLILTFKAEDLVLFDQVPCRTNMFINTIRHTSRMVCLYYIRMHVYIIIYIYIRTCSNLIFAGNSSGGERLVGHELIWISDIFWCSPRRAIRTIMIHRVMCSNLQCKQISVHDIHFAYKDSHDKHI